MRPRTVGKMVLIGVTLALAIAAFVQAVTTSEHKSYRGKRAIALAVLALVGATGVRYFED